MNAYDPASVLAHKYPGWRVVEALLPDDIDGYTEFATRTVVVDSRLNADQMRSVLAHELVHVELGHDGPQSDLVEAAVEMIAADRLIGDAGKAVELTCLRSAAHQLGVDSGTLAAWRRLQLIIAAA